jgi:hypothetical protein
MFFRWITKIQMIAENCMRGVEGGRRRAESYDSEKAWSSINHAILSAQRSSSKKNLIFSPTCPNLPRCNLGNGYGTREANLCMHAVLSCTRILLLHSSNNTSLSPSSLPTPVRPCMAEKSFGKTTQDGTTLVYRAPAYCSADCRTFILQYCRSQQEAAQSK